MIIIEGADELGKTTLARSLGEAVHMSKPDGIPDYLNLLQPGKVHDRFHLGAMVYGMALKKHDYLPWMDFRRLHSAIAMRGWKTIVLYTEHETWYRERLIRGKPQMFSVETVMDANRCYRELFYDIEATCFFHVGETGFADVEAIKRTLEEERCWL